MDLNVIADKKHNFKYIYNSPQTQLTQYIVNLLFTRATNTHQHFKENHHYHSKCCLAVASVTLRRPRPEQQHQVLPGIIGAVFTFCFGSEQPPPGSCQG